MGKKTKAAVGGAAAVIACCVPTLQIWEGMDKTARVDPIGTGHPVTYCYGQTAEFGRVKAGTTFTTAQCNDLLAKSLPDYLAKIEPCITRPIPTKSEAALLDAAYNAGPVAICHSPMVARMNVGDIRGGCNAFSGWYVRASGRVVQGLINRRNGERKLCLEGLTAPQPAPVKFSWWAWLKSIFSH
jgi:lysozyme